ncbi:hypothetical protein [Alicyclobacillus shizuokensis]|uniref:hypothetical protein n=1 Tax=Alicyclobacillus shizuokensis TaxID=392014 RepID=UPI000834376C|nr:hypothetical protein [Alicyclobacillus shizuokensis]
MTHATETSIRVGDYVIVPLYHGKHRDKRSVTDAEPTGGKVVYANDRFAVVRLDNGYCESFWLEDVQRV